MKKNIFYCVILSFLSLATFIDCKRAFCADTQILAKIGEHVITSEQFKWLVEQLPMEQRASLLVDKNSREKFLDRLIDTRLVYLEALRMGFDKNTDVIKKMELAKEQIVVSKYMEDIINQKIKISHEAVEEFYRINRERFIFSNPIRIRHILVLTENEAKEILEGLKHGEDFAVLAQKKSIDPSGKRGGDLGWLEKRVMDPELARVAFSLNIGGVRTSGGGRIHETVDVVSRYYRLPVPFVSRYVSPHYFTGDLVQWTAKIFC